MTFLVREFEAKWFRSLKAIRYPISNLDVFVGANGVGKTNLYRALELLQAAASNTLAHELSIDGGLKSAFWAGPRKNASPARIYLSVAVAVDSSDPNSDRLYRYEVEIGFPPEEVSASFQIEPQIKSEAISFVNRGRTVRLIDRNGPSVMGRDENGRPVEVDIDLLDSETVLGRLEDPGRFPELDALRRSLLQWRFYHNLRTDPASPIRRPCLAIATPTLASDGSNLAAVFATLAHIRQDTTELDTAVKVAFPGAKLMVPYPESVAKFGMIFPEFPHRVFEAHELSDGTLRFLALAGALLSYRLPPFVALNEPESSLHPELMEAVASLVVKASHRTQTWLVTHSSRLAEAISAQSAGNVRLVEKINGATEIVGLKPWGRFSEHDD